MARKNRSPEEKARREKIRELLQMADISSMDDIQNLFKETIAEFMENGLEAELDEELGYSKYDYKNKETNNSRNGHSSKTLRTSFGDVEVSVPRDRKGEFEPQVLKKNQTSISQDIEEKILSMYAKGMTTGDMEAHIQEKQSLNVERTLEYVKNRNLVPGGPRYCFVEGSTKTTSGDRTIPLNQTALQALRELQKINGQFSLAFANATGKPINPRNLNRAHDCILERAGIPHIGIHTLRHTFASQLFANKVDIKIVSRLLGHADVGITYNTYIHLLKEDLPSATNTLDGILNAG